MQVLRWEAARFRWKNFCPAFAALRFPRLSPSPSREDFSILPSLVSHLQWNSSLCGTQFVQSPWKPRNTPLAGPWSVCFSLRNLLDCCCLLLSEVSTSVTSEISALITSAQLSTHCYACFHHCCSGLAVWFASFVFPCQGQKFSECLCTDAVFNFLFCVMCILLKLLLMIWANTFTPLAE